MRILSMKHLVVAAVLFLAPPAMSQAYGPATITNTFGHPANVVVNYAACRADRFTVPAATLGKDYTPAVASPTARRGACLITSITATFVGDTASIVRYHSMGTSKSQFRIKEAGMNDFRAVIRAD